MSFTDFFQATTGDALWVLDETQLMGVGVETCAQLDGFRAREEWRTLGWTGEAKHNPTPQPSQNR